MSCFDLRERIGCAPIKKGLGASTNRLFAMSASHLTMYNVLFVSTRSASTSLRADGMADFSGRVSGLGIMNGPVHL